MVNCDICDILNHKDDFNLIYEDESVFAILHENPAMLGHALVIPKKHYRIFEEVPDEETKQLFKVANAVSTLIFENAAAMGTNIIINNGIGAKQDMPHVIVNVIPRKENDGINFEWPTKKASEEDLKSAQDMIGSVIEEVFLGKEKTPTVVKEQKSETIQGENNYLLKQLKRIP